MQRPRQGLDIERSFGMALRGEFRPRAANGKVQTLLHLAFHAYLGGMSELDLSPAPVSSQPGRVLYFSTAPWMTDVELCLGGHDNSNPVTGEVLFEPNLVRLRRGGRQMLVVYDHQASVYDAGEPRGPRLTVEGFPDEWDQSINTLPLDVESLPETSRVVAHAAALFFNKFE